MESLIIWSFWKIKYKTLCHTFSVNRAGTLLRLVYLQYNKLLFKSKAIKPVELLNALV